MSNPNKFSEFFYNQPKPHYIHKWTHYFDIYDKHFNKFKGKSPTILEIGVFKGGSLDMWNYYFDNECVIYGVDNNPECKKIQDDFSNVTVLIGDQGDPAFWDGIIAQNLKFDIILDDGGHHMHQQITTFEKAYGLVKEGGVYMCEDTHTSYWGEFGGGFKLPSTFIEYSKNFIDSLHAHHYYSSSLEFRKNTHCVSYYDSIVALEKKRDDARPYYIERDKNV